MSVYNAAVHFEPGRSGITNVNSVFAATDEIDLYSGFENLGDCRSAAG